MVKFKTLRSVLFCLVLIFALPFSFGELTGLTTWFSPFLMLNSILLLKSFVIANIAGFIILALAVYKKRWFCGNMCPVGFLQDIISSVLKNKRQFSMYRIPVFSKWLVFVSFGGALLGFPVFIFMDPIVIFNGFFIPLIKPFEVILLICSALLPALLILHLVFPHLWCEKICPLGGLQLIIKDLSSFNKISARPTIVDESRRLFIGGALGAVTTLIFPDLTENNFEPIRPPASIANKSFNALCVRCGSCIKVCPSKILKHETRMGMGLFTPAIKFDKGYCIESCNSCGNVCPSGAITKFSINAKRHLKIARVNVRQDTCLLMKFKECGICKSACHYDSLSYEPCDESSIQLKPVVNDITCNGCGACSVICPEKCFEMIHL